MSVYDYAESKDVDSQAKHQHLPAQNKPKINIFSQEYNNPNMAAHSRWAKRNEAKLSVEFDYKGIVKDEVDKVQQFKDTVKLLEDNKLMQGLAHQIHLWFRQYVNSDVKGYIKNYGTTEVTKDRVSAMLDVFKGHMMTILGKLVEGMSATYLSYLFKTKDDKKDNDDNGNGPIEEFERLANQWSMHQLSPRTINLSITSIQSAISKEIMFEPFDNTMSREIKIPNGLRDVHKYLKSPQTKRDQSEEEWPKTEKMYDRIEFMRQAGKAKIQNLVLPGENKQNISSSRGSIEKNLRRISKRFLKDVDSRMASKESERSKESQRSKGSASRDSQHINLTTVGRWISTRALKKLPGNSNSEMSDPYTMVRNTSRENNMATPILSLKSTTIQTSSEHRKENDTYILEQRRVQAATPWCDGPKLNTTYASKKRSGSGGKNNENILDQWVNFKIAGTVKGKGRNKIKIGMSSTSNLQKTGTIELKKKQLFKAINLRNSPKYLQEPKLKLVANASQKSSMIFTKPKTKILRQNKNNDL
jgi:hypothetical protein